MAGVGALLMERITELAPNASWQFAAWTANSAHDLETGQICYGIQYQNPDFPPSIYQRHCIQDEGVLAARAGHPLVNEQRQFDLKEVPNWPMLYLNVSGWNDYHNYINHELAKFNLTPPIYCSTDNMNNALELLENSDYIMSTTQLSILKKPNIVALKTVEKTTLDFINLVSCYRNNSKDSGLIHWLNEIVDDLKKSEFNNT